MDTRINNGMCRCCASDGTSKDLCSTYHWMGDEEVYSDMLKECFDITLETSNEGGICEVCITQLRNASNFKKQVLKTEQQFKNILQDKLFRSSIVKVEVPTINDEDSDNDNHMSEDFSGTDYEIPIKMETPEEPKSKKRAAKATTSRTKKARGDDGETSTKRAPQRAVVEKEKGSKNLRVQIRNIKKENKEDEAPSKSKLRLIKLVKMDKYRTNITEIMRCSNATPIANNNGLGYTCSFCSNVFPMPADLKQHVINEHNEDDKSRLVTEKDLLYKFYLKIDITALCCKLCDADIDSLELLMDHLIIVHNKKIHTNIENPFLPFKFDSEVLKCYICSSVFNKFKILLEHMNVHYRNYICEVCDAGYVTQGKLLAHKEGHKIGVFKCDFCPKEYDTNRKRKLHEKAVHIHLNRLHKCGFCSERFTGVKSKDDHMTKVHGVRKNTLKCQACDKVFGSQGELRIHTKRDHLMERRYKCTQCDMNFFSNSELKDHMVKHSGVRDFQCEVCLKAYGRKKTLREHMRIHKDDRRFKCEHCGQAFVQKCSWAAHVRTKHRDLM